MYILASNIWFTKLMKQFFFLLDKIVYNFISIIYDVMISIARTSVLTQADIAEMSGRIYKLLAIFMIFKVTLSLITYVVNPDDFSDKSKGVSKLGINIIISMALLILTPYIFSYAYQFQTIVLEDNSLGTLIFGGDNGDESFFNTAGDKISYTVMKPFFTPNTSINGLNSCSILVLEKEGNEKVFNPDCSGLNEDLTPRDSDSNTLYALTEDNETFTSKDLVNYVVGVESENLGLMFREELAVATYKTNTGETEFIMDYKFIFSTVTGIVIILLLITFCMDIAVRSIKLAFLQLAAPIPIISYVDPKSGKDGMFKKWYEMCIKTFLSLFIRLIALYFAVFVISKVADLRLVDVVDGSYVRDGIISIFIIIGALMFAKQLPKMLEGLGIKLDSGSFTLNPFKKIENDAIGGKKLVGFTKGALGAAGAMGAATLASTAGTIGNVKSRWASTDDKDKWKLLAGGLTSGVSAGLKAGTKGFGGAMRGEKMGKNFTNSYKQAMSSETKRLDRLSDGVLGTEVLYTNVQQALGIRTKSQKTEIAKEKFKYASDKYNEARTNVLAADGVAKNLNEQLKVLEASGVDRSDYVIKDGTGKATGFDDEAYNKAVIALANRKKQINDAIDARVKEIMSGDKHDPKSKVYSDGTVVWNPDGTVARYEGQTKELSTNTEYVRRLTEDMVDEATKAQAITNTITEGVNATIDSKDPKTTAKSSLTASSAVTASPEGSHAKKVGKYTKSDKSNK